VGCEGVFEVGGDVEVVVGEGVELRGVGLGVVEGAVADNL
jgi:hypothetical protein